MCGDYAELFQKSQEKVKKISQKRKFVLY
jgi:hypothetical protein